MSSSPPCFNYSSVAANAAVDESECDQESESESMGMSEEDDAPSPPPRSPRSPSVLDSPCTFSKEVSEVAEVVVVEDGLRLDVLPLQPLQSLSLKQQQQPPLSLQSHQNQNNTQFNVETSSWDPLTRAAVAALECVSIVPVNHCASVNPVAAVFVLADDHSVTVFLAVINRLWSLASSEPLNLVHQQRVGFDVECGPFNCPATLQLAFTPNLVAVFKFSCSNPVDSGKRRFPTLLKHLLESNVVQKAGVGTLEDGNRLRAFYHVNPQNFVDCEDIAKAANIGARSLVSLFHIYVNPNIVFKVPRSASGIDWTSQILSTEAIEYATNDCIASLLVLNAMINPPFIPVSPWDAERAFFSSFQSPQSQNVPAPLPLNMTASEYSIDSEKSSRSTPQAAFSSPIMTLDSPSFIQPVRDIAIETGTNIQGACKSPTPPQTWSELVRKPPIQLSNTPRSLVNASLKRKLVSSWNKYHPTVPIITLPPNHPKILPIFEQTLFKIISPHIIYPSNFTHFKFHIFQLLKITCAFWKQVQTSLPPETAIQCQPLCAIQDTCTQRALSLDLVAIWITNGQIVDLDITAQPMARVSAPWFRAPSAVSPEFLRIRKRLVVAWNKWFGESAGRLNVGDLVGGTGGGAGGGVEVSVEFEEAMWDVVCPLIVFPRDMQGQGTFHVFQLMKVVVANWERVWNGCGCGEGNGVNYGAIAIGVKRLLALNMISGWFVQGLLAELQDYGHPVAKVFQFANVMCTF
ncbi:hypothetical protein BCR33DRAFT_854759 [Rhizoclosmatium globosum]|uniref:3'-5' exonuclease n=1 Tax=Rhizoclosmatium globosum TaxID=329046 RepID=A0A1Y2BRV9_9FUNG|nr:hypothetical protein BCR33DRAFT_854759 [Rhizoclosmatium globosum]|eukprot:ORY37480.1 hypothetical protein BCR33DRAFT_854759 [Rhizoclosmatium globosum]